MLGQYDAGSVTGTVHDSTGAAVAGAKVTLHSLERNVDLDAKTSGSGQYTFPDVRVGNYTVTISAPAFQPVTTSALELLVSARLRVDVPLLPAGVNEIVEVSSGGTALETDTSDRGQVIAQEQIQDLPLNGREYTDLAFLTPGVQQGSLQDGTVEQRRGSFNVNGMRSSVNNFLLDGLDNNSYADANQGFNNQALTTSVDAVREFKITTSNYPAEFGRSGGAVINTTTRGGTNQFHASAWEYVRNTVFNAYGPFLGSGHKPTLIQNQFGATAGGPLMRNKTFYFLDYEGFRQITGTQIFSTIPNAQQKQGIFVNESGTPIPLKNPLTGAVHNDGIIPQSDVTPFAAAVIAALPTATFPQTYSSNFVYLGRGQVTRDQADLRVDETVSHSTSMFVRLSQQVIHIVEAPPFPGLAGGNQNGRPHVVTSRLAYGYTQQLSTRSLLDARFGYTQTRSGKLPYNYGSPSFYSQFNIPYPVDPAAGTTALDTETVQGFTAFGTQATQHLFQNPYIIEPKVSYTTVLGRHTVNVGYAYLSLSMYATRNSPVYGHNTYNQTGFVAAPTTTVGSTARQQAYAMANFMYGTRSIYELSKFDSVEENRRSHSAFVEDTWHALPKLTLNLGLRYELPVPDFETNNHLANFDPATNTLQLAKNGSYASRALVNLNHLDFSPRIGFAYSPATNFVVRGSYGISYILNDRQSSAGLEFNGPYSVDTPITQATLPAVGTVHGDASGQFCPDGSLSLACFRTTQQGFPTTMTSPNTFNTATAEAYYQPRHLPNGYLQFYSLGYQAQLDPRTLLDIAYVGEHGVHILVFADWNQAAPESGATNVALALRRPIANFTDISSGLPLGFLHYNALQVKLQRQYRGLFLLNSFSWSQARDNASGDSEAAHGDSQYVNIRNLGADSGISGYNQPVNNTTALIYTLPKAHFGYRILAQALDGWSLTTISRITSGLPLNLNYTPAAAALTTDLGLAYRPNYTGNLTTVLNPKSQWARGAGGVMSNVFSTTQLSTPAATQPYGNLPRNAVRFVPRVNVDLGLQKQFRLVDRTTLQFRAEAFNVLNKTNYSAPGLTTNDTGSFGNITAAGPSRQIQFALRLNY